MARKSGPTDVLVVGEHPCACLATILMCAGKVPVRVTQITFPSPCAADRLVLINPAFFSLHPVLGPLKKKLKLSPVGGARFLADDIARHNEHRSRTTMAFIGRYSELLDAMLELAQQAGAKVISPSSLRIEHVDHQGMELIADGNAVSGKMLLLASALPDEDSRKLTLPEPWSAEIIRRYSYLRISSADHGSVDNSSIPMSLDLGGGLTWAWMLRGQGEVQLSVEQPIGENRHPRELLELWTGVLEKHGLLKLPMPIENGEICSFDVPAGGALSRDTVGNRTLLIGPAGGFFTACLEDIYPNCWSAIFAVETARKALREEHLQDALAPYRQTWGTTLGEYLRGPQQNLRFLLPLVYRNAVMTTRLAESILLGKSVVR